MRSSRAVPFFTGLLLASLPALGCGGGAEITGRLVVNGQPLKPEGSELVQITLLSTGTERTSYVASFNPADSTFVVAGPERQGIPAGKYRISVSCLPYQPVAGQLKDRFDNAFGPDKSPLQVDVPAGAKQAIVVDLGSKTVAKE